MSKVQGAWVLTREHNEYDQHGSYFAAVWPTKPTIEQLVAYFGYDNPSSSATSVMGALAFILHLHKGGGRQANEDQWYNLTFAEFGKNCEEG